MNSSQEIDKLAAALVAAQKEMKNPSFDAKNPHFGSKYASLVAVRESVVPVLNKHGLAITQFPKYGNGYAGCVSRLMHTSGQWLEEECLLPVGKETAHAAGSCLTYTRRYGLQSIAGVVADEDDDANAAVLNADEQTWLNDIAEATRLELSAKGGLAAMKMLEEQDLEVHYRVALWSRFTPAERAAMEPHKRQKKAA
jgi:hypothetical protein